MKAKTTKRGILSCGAIYNGCTFWAILGELLKTVAPPIFARFAPSLPDYLPLGLLGWFWARVDEIHTISPMKDNEQFFGSRPWCSLLYCLTYRVSSISFLSLSLKSL